MRERIRLGQVDQGILEEGNNPEKEKRHKNKKQWPEKDYEKIYLLNGRKNREFFEKLLPRENQEIFYENDKLEKEYRHQKFF